MKEVAGNTVRSEVMAQVPIDAVIAEVGPSRHFSDFPTTHPSYAAEREQDFRIADTPRNQNLFGQCNGGIVSVNLKAALLKCLCGVWRHGFG
jgi:hypothetical protein